MQVVDDRLVRINVGELKGVPEYRAGFRDRLLSRCGVDEPRSTDAPVLANGAGAFDELAFVDGVVDTARTAAKTWSVRPEGLRPGGDPTSTDHRGTRAAHHAEAISVKGVGPTRH